MARRVRITALRWVKPPMATSMRLRTGIHIQTPGVAGKVQAQTLQNTTHQATLRRRAVQLRVAGEGRRRVVDLRPSTAEGAAGSPGRQVLVAQQAVAGAVAGEAAGEPNGEDASDNKLGEQRP